MLSHAELYRFIDYRWESKFISESKGIEINDLNKFKYLMIPLLNKLNENNAIFLFKTWELNPGYAFTLWTQREINEFIPLSSCTSLAPNIRKFTTKEGRELWRHLLEVIESKDIAIKKLEEGTIEVNSVLPNQNIYAEDFNIAWIESCKMLEKCYSWPINEWNWKPWRLYLNLLNSNFDNRIDLMGEINKTVIEKVLKMNFLMKVSILDIASEVYLSNLNYLEQISRQFPKMKLLFDIKHDPF